MSAYANSVWTAIMVRLASDLTGISEAMLLGPRRTRHLCEIRFACMKAMRSKGMSYPEIGRLMCRDHQTVMMGIKRAQELGREPEYAALIAALENAA